VTGTPPIGLPLASTTSYVNTADEVRPAPPEPEKTIDAVDGIMDTNLIAATGAVATSIGMFTVAPLAVATTVSVVPHPLSVYVTDACPLVAEVVADAAIVARLGTAEAQAEVKVTVTGAAV